MILITSVASCIHVVSTGGLFFHYNRPFGDIYGSGSGAPTSRLGGFPCAGAQADRALEVILPLRVAAPTMQPHNRRCTVLTCGRVDAYCASVLRPSEELCSAL